MNLGKFFNQKAIYWPPDAPDGYGGYTYLTPVEVSVRWTLKQEEFLTYGKGSLGNDAMNAIQTLLSKVVVLSETDFEYKGRMTLGLLVNLDSDDTPDTMKALTIEGFEKIPTIKADQFLRKAWLN